MKSCDFPCTYCPVCNPFVSFARRPESVWSNESNLVLKSLPHMLKLPNITDHWRANGGRGRQGRAPGVQILSFHAVFGTKYAKL